MIPKQRCLDQSRILLGMACQQEMVNRQTTIPPTLAQKQGLEVMWLLVGMYAAAGRGELIDMEAVRSTAGYGPR